MIKPVLIFGYGNLSRGDDALGPLLLEHIENNFASDAIEILTDFQLQIEHALDLEDRELVLFVDASVSNQSAFNFSKLQAAKDKSYTTHAMSPTALLHVYQNIKKQSPPPCFLLSIQGVSFELGEDLSKKAEVNLQLAIQFTQQLLNTPELNYWDQKKSI